MELERIKYLWLNIWINFNHFHIVKKFYEKFMLNQKKDTIFCFKELVD